MKRAFHAMESKGVWRIVTIPSMPLGRVMAGNGLVLSDLDDGFYISRTVD
jgi:hypothetical protein